VTNKEQKETLIMPLDMKITASQLPTTSHNAQHKDTSSSSQPASKLHEHSLPLPNKYFGLSLNECFYGRSLSAHGNSKNDNEFPNFDLFQDLDANKFKQNPATAHVEKNTFTAQIEDMNDSLMKSLQRGFQKCADMIEDEAQQQTQNDKIQMIEISQLEIQLYLAMASNIQKENMYDYPYISSAVQNMLQYYFSKF